MYILLILLAMELTGFYLLRSLETYYLNSYSLSLNLQAQLAAGLVQRYMEDVADKEDRQNIERLASEFDPQLGASLLVMDNSGLVLGVSPGNWTLLNKQLEPRDEITQALSGSRGENIRLDEATGQRYLHLALPIRQGDQVMGVVYLKGSLERTYATLGQIRLFLLYATALALAVTAALGLALARTITGPIREVTSRAAQMAAGNFDQMIQVRSNDEIGQLGAMFNHLAYRLKETLGQISEEKNKVEAILTYMADGIVALDKKGRIILCNPAAAKMLSAREQDVIGRSPMLLWPEANWRSPLREVLSTNQPVTRQIAIERPVHCVLRCHFTPLRGEKGKAVGLVIVFHDVTEQEKLESMRKEFVANVSHELRTPLTTVKSYIETLLDGAAEDPSTRERFLAVVSSETDRMVRLVRDLLHLSHLDQRTASLDIQPVDLAILAEETLAKLQGPCERKQLKLVRAWPGDLPRAAADRDKIQQVLLNILANAIEFTPSGGQISVGIADDGGLLRVRVADTGIGIPREDLPRIFERFYRVDKARSRELGGTGLGLAIAKQIVEAHGGEISIESEFGAGTEVSFTLSASGLDLGQAREGSA
jgi:two-component system sensor histidine kinase VicK